MLEYLMNNKEIEYSKLYKINKYLDKKNLYLINI